MTAEDTRELIDSLTRMNATLDKARCLMQLLTEDFFEKHDPETKAGAFSLLWEFRKYRTITRLLDDCLVQLYADIPSADRLENAARKGGEST